MTKVDQFESAFKSAAKTLFELVPVNIETVLILTDLPAPEAEAWGARAKQFLRVLASRQESVTFKVVPGDAFRSVRDLLDLIAEEAPDLVVTYRSLHSQAWPWTYTLGRHVDVLAQESPMPVLLLPNPHAETQKPDAEPPKSAQPGRLDYDVAGTRCVMALTDHLTGEHRLVSNAAHLTEKDGTLVLAHVEDGRAFDRIMDAITKIPALDTETAAETIRAQLLKEPHDYVRSCAKGLAEAGAAIEVKEVVSMGHHLAEVKRMVAEHDVGLLVLDTKDEDQHAMHGLAYPLVIELRRLPILML